MGKHTVLACLGAIWFTVTAPAARYNVLFVAIDDLNDWVGCLGGHPQASTPNIDRLAETGMLFTNAHCAAPLCNPSRTAVLTGKHPVRSGVFRNQQDWRKSPYLQGHPTLPRYFKDHGYWTGAAGKIFHANHGGECAALNGGHGGLRGFDDPTAWVARFPSRGRQLPRPAVLPGQNFNGLDVWHWDWGPIDVSDCETTDGRTIAWAIEQIKTLRDRPWFLAVGIYRPHGPWYVPREYFEAFELSSVALPEVPSDDLDDVPAIAKRYLQNPRSNWHAIITRRGLWRSAVRAYLANVMFADRMLGHLLRALRESGQEESTIVCLWSDHGWHLGEKQRWHKSTLWEEATRVPLIIRVPGLVRAGSVCDEAVSLIDLYPTLLDVCGLPRAVELDGISLLPLLNDASESRGRPVLTTLGGQHHSVRDRRWRYTRYSDGSEELYDHATDPNEWHNLSDDPRFAEVKNRLASYLPREVVQVPPDTEEKENAGFRPIFNGRDLTSWDGNPEYWTVEAGAITGRTTADNPLPYNTFLIWRGKEVSDFELKLEFRIEGTMGWANSGIQYRSRELPEVGRWVLGGYQADIDLSKRYLGILYEERGRGILALRGQKVIIHPATAMMNRRRPFRIEVVGTLGDPDELVADIDLGEWNTYRIIARGNHLVHEINGRKMVEVTDNDQRHRAMKGLIGLQLHRGQPMKVQFRKIMLKEY